MSVGSPKPLGATDFLRMEVAEFLRRTQGRETFHGGPLPGFPAGCIVKRTRSVGGGWLRPWRARSARAAGRREHDNLVALEKAGVRVPRAVAWADGVGAGGGGAERIGEVGISAERISAKGIGAEGYADISVVVMERIEHSRTLRDELEQCDASARGHLGAQLLELVTRLHTSGFHHRDLYLQHVIVRSGDDALVLIDVARVHRGRRTRWLVKDLAALSHSTPMRVTARERLRFAAGWLDAMTITGRDARRRLLRAVERKRERIASHVPKDERAIAKSAR